MAVSPLRQGQEHLGGGFGQGAGETARRRAPERNVQQEEGEPCRRTGAALDPPGGGGERLRPVGEAHLGQCLEVRVVERPEAVVAAGHPVGGDARQAQFVERGGEPDGEPRTLGGFAEASERSLPARPVDDPDDRREPRRRGERPEPARRKLGAREVLGEDGQTEAEGAEERAGRASRLRHLVDQPVGGVAAGRDDEERPLRAEPLEKPAGRRDSQRRPRTLDESLGHRSHYRTDTRQILSGKRAPPPGPATRSAFRRNAASGAGGTRSGDRAVASCPRAR